MEKIKTLVSLSEMLNKAQSDYLNGFIDLTEFNRLTVAYDTFLSQPLALWMFVPVDANGNVLEESMCNDGEMATAYYKDAKSKCLFEGFKVIGNDDDGVEIEMIDNDIWVTILSTSININHYNGIEWEIKTVEEMFEFLKEYGLQASLSATALNKIY